MAVRKYLDNTGLAEVAEHVNTRLKTVSTMPVTADEGAVRLFTGETTATYIKGHIYQMKPTTEQYLQFSAGETTYFMTEDGTITDVAPASYSPQIEDVPFTDPETGATLVYMAGNNVLVQKLGNDVNVITVNFNKIKTSVMPWWTAGAATGSYNPYTIRNVKLVAVTTWVDITPSGVENFSANSASSLLSAWTDLFDDTVAVVNATASFPLTEDYNLPIGRHLLLKGGSADKTTLWTNDGRTFSGVIEDNVLVWTDLLIDTASEVSYDNTTSELVATDVQAAIDELVTIIKDKLDKVSTMPAEPSDGDTVLYDGTTTADYIHGHIYTADTDSEDFNGVTVDSGFYNLDGESITEPSSPTTGEAITLIQDGLGLCVDAVAGKLFVKDISTDETFLVSISVEGAFIKGGAYTPEDTTEPTSANLISWTVTDVTWKDVSTFDADTIPYDNTDSGLAATNVQDAIDEVDANDKTKLKKVTTLPAEPEVGDTVLLDAPVSGLVEGHIYKFKAVSTDHVGIKADDVFFDMNGVMIATPTDPTSGASIEVVQGDLKLCYDETGHKLFVTDTTDGSTYEVSFSGTGEFVQGSAYTPTDSADVASAEIDTWETSANEWVDLMPIPAVDQVFDSASANAQSGTAVNEAIQTAIIQLSTLPTPSADNLGKIVQYVGADTLELKNGLFYQVQIIAESDPAEYYWNSIKVSNCSEKQDKVLETPITVQGVEKTTVEGALGAINDAVESLPSIMTPKGSVTFANLPAIADRYVEVTPVGTENPSEEGWYEMVDDNYVLSEDTEVDSEKTYYQKVSPTVDVQLGWLYNITDAFVTTDEFMEGAGKSYGAGQNVVAVEYTEGVKKWDVLSGELNLSDYKTIWNGTREAWNNLPLAEKQRYDLANLTDDLAGGEIIVSDTVTEGDLNPVTSNAVFDATQTVIVGTITVKSSKISQVRRNSLLYKNGVGYLAIEFDLSTATLENEILFEIDKSTSEPQLFAVATGYIQGTSSGVLRVEGNEIACGAPISAGIVWSGGCSFVISHS